MTRSGCCSALPLPARPEGAERARTSPTSMPPAITAFLQHLQDDRGNSVRTRNARLAAVHSLFALRGPAPSRARRADTAGPGHPRQAPRPHRSSPTSPRPRPTRSWPPPTRPPGTGRRDRALLALAVHTGLRVSELTSLTCADIRPQAPGRTSPATGKAARNAITPLLSRHRPVLRSWLAERGGQPADPLFPDPPGHRLSRDAVERRVTLYAERASAACPSLTGQARLLPTLRHSYVICTASDPVRDVSSAA